MDDRGGEPVDAGPGVLPSDSGAGPSDAQDEPDAADTLSAAPSADAGRRDPCASCDDGSGCTIDTCVDGHCVYTPLDCEDGNPCTLDRCGDGGCVHTEANCNDPTSCTIDQCVDGSCVFIPLDCDDGDPCTVDACATDPNGDDHCTHAALDCQDLTSCTIDECVDGQCVHIPKDCDDGEPCTTDHCNLGKCFSVTMHCQDGTSCTTDECVNGACVNTPIVDCDDGDPCTTDKCYAKECYHTVKKCNGCECECGGPPLVCDDYSKCTVDYCEDDQCVFAPSEACQDDGNPCTEAICYPYHWPDGCLQIWTAGCQGPLIAAEAACQASMSCQTKGHCVAGMASGGDFQYEGCVKRSCETAQDCPPAADGLFRACVFEECRYPEIVCNGPCRQWAPDGTCTVLPDGTECDTSATCRLGTCMPEEEQTLVCGHWTRPWVTSAGRYVPVPENQITPLEPTRWVTRLETFSADWGPGVGEHSIGIALRDASGNALGGVLVGTWYGSSPHQKNGELYLSHRGLVGSRYGCDLYTTDNAGWFSMYGLDEPFQFYHFNTGNCAHVTYTVGVGDEMAFATGVLDPANAFEHHWDTAELGTGSTVVTAPDGCSFYQPWTPYGPSTRVHPAGAFVNRLGGEPCVPSVVLTVPGTPVITIPETVLGGTFSTGDITAWQATESGVLIPYETADATAAMLHVTLEGEATLAPCASSPPD